MTDFGLSQAQIDKRLYDLSIAHEKGTEDLDNANIEARKAKIAWDVSSAKVRMSLRARAVDSGRKMTKDEVDDEALVRCEAEYVARITSEQIAESCKAHLYNVRVQTDIARSLNASVRSAMSIG